MDTPDDKKRLFELQLANFQSISKTQKVFLHALVSYLALVWGWQLLGSGNEVSIQVLGVSVKAAGFRPVTPLVLTFLSLGLIGAMNAIGPTWKRLRRSARTLDAQIDFYDLDINKNFVDYLTFLSIHPEKPIVGRDENARFNIARFYYPLFIAGAIWTTYYARTRLPASHFYAVYFWLCFGFQVLFSIRVFWLAICRFFGIRRRQLES